MCVCVCTFIVAFQACNTRFYYFAILPFTMLKRCSCFQDTALLNTSGVLMFLFVGVQQNRVVVVPFFFRNVPLFIY